MNGGRFLLVAMRDGGEVQHAEYEDFLISSGLTTQQLDHFPICSTEAELPNLQQYDGVFVGGSPFNVTDLEHTDLQKHSHDLLYSILKSSVPALFTCYGTSYTAFTFGGLVTRKYGERAGITDVTLTANAASDPVVSSLPNDFAAVTGHKEAVVELPEDAVLLATGSMCPIQMYRIKNNWITQFHPEMDADRILRRMSFYANDGYFKAEELAEIDEQVHSVDLSFVETIIPNFVKFCTTRNCNEN